MSDSEIIYVSKSDLRDRSLTLAIEFLKNRKHFASSAGVVLTAQSFFDYLSQDFIYEDNEGESDGTSA